MADQGFLTHAVRNRRKTAFLLGAYLLAFEFIGAYLLILPLLFFDNGNSILSNPLGYAQRYALPVAVVGGLIFWRLYRGHAKEVARQMRVSFVTRQQEARFVHVAEEVCTTLGVRFPRFGVIEQPQPNALSVGEGPNHGLIAVTRGMLETLDDDELAAVLAHEASHIRQGDTRVMAANHAMMRTAVVFQTHNPLRIEDWRQLILPLFVPPALIILLMSSATTRFAMALARWARRGVKLSRDHLADSESVRVTQFPEALLTAFGKVGGKGAFPGSWRVEDLLFDGPADREGGRHPAISERIAAVTRFGQTLMNANRGRRDTRSLNGEVPREREFRSRIGISYDAEGRPTERPPQSFLIFLAMLRNYFTDRATFDEWQAAEVSWFEWRESDYRNSLGLTPVMVVPMAALCAFLLVFHWPADNDLKTLAGVFDPGKVVELADKMQLSGTWSVSSAPSEESAIVIQAGPSAAIQTAKLPVDAPQSRQLASGDVQPGPPEAPILAYLFVVLVTGAMILQAVRPDLANKLRRRSPRRRIVSSDKRTRDCETQPRVAPSPPHDTDRPDFAMPPSPPGSRTFGRKQA